MGRDAHRNQRTARQPIAVYGMQCSLRHPALAGHGLTLHGASATGSRWRDAQGHTGAVHDMTACGQEGSLGASLASISADKSCIVWEVCDKRLRGFGPQLRPSFG